MSRFDEKAWSQTGIAKLLKQAKFMTSAAAPKGYPEDMGIEVGFAGRSNVGKSTCLNAITQQTRLAHTSKTPGRTQLINFFELSPTQKLIDLPGYGYAKVPPDVQKQWAKNIEAYLTQRDSLAGMVWLVDSRRELNGDDFILLKWLVSENIETQILLCKIDKLSRNQGQQALHRLNKQLKDLNVPRDLVRTQVYSSTSKEGLMTLTARLDEWFSKSLNDLQEPQEIEPGQDI